MRKKQYLIDNKELMKEWNYEKNKNLDPQKLTYGSNIKVWWKCNKNHEWQAAPNNRCKGHSCPYCSGRYADKNNNITVLYPELMKEWDYEKNDINPIEIKSKSEKKVWWKCCICGNQWKTTVAHRTSGTGCPKCSKELHTSFPEQAVYYYIKKVYSDTINGYQDIENDITEIDIYIPSLKVGFEYDGKYFHTNIEKDHKKNKIVEKNGIKLYRIKETSKFERLQVNNNDIYYNNSKIENLNSVIEYILKDILNNNINFDISVEVDRFNIWSQYITYAKSKSLYNRYPELVKEWDYTKNKGLRPENVTSSCDKRVWWVCSNGHSYDARIYNRIRSGCPYCSNQKVLNGYNDLKSKFPYLCKEWDYTKNNDLYPELVLFSSAKKVWWKCSVCGNEWQASVLSRTKLNSGCPKCGIKKASNTKSMAITGINDLKTINPILAEELHPTKNLGIKAENIIAGSGKKVWWKCKEGHEWQATPDARIRKKSGCPYCSGRYADKNNNITVLYPELMKEWDYEKNNINPLETKSGSGKKVWWKCAVCGNEWEAVIRDRTQKGRSCPNCRKIKE